MVTPEPTTTLWNLRHLFLTVCAMMNVISSIAVLSPMLRQSGSWLQHMHTNRPVQSPANVLGVTTQLLGVLYQMQQTLLILAGAAT
jgi:hypothetical protein